MFKFGKASEKRLTRVVDELVKVARLALTKSKVDFGISCGIRSGKQQLLLIEQGKSWTVNSKHLPCHCCGMSHAIDVYAWVDGKVNWEFKYYLEIKKAMFQAAKELGVKLKWGGNWKGVKRDGPHYQTQGDLNDT